MATSTMMLWPLCTRQVVSCGVGGGEQAAGRAEGTHLGQERGDEDEEDVVDEEYEQQQSAGLWEAQPHPQDLCLGAQHPDPRAPRSSDLHQGLSLPCPLAALTLKVGRRMVFSMYRQKAMPRVSCKIHAHLGGECSLNDLELTLPHPTPSHHQGPTTKLQAPPSLLTQTLRPQKQEHRRARPTARTTEQLQTDVERGSMGAQGSRTVPVIPQLSQNTQLWDSGVGPAQSQGQGLAAQREGQKQASCL